MGVKNTGNTPSAPDQEKSSDEEEPGNQNNYKSSLCFKDALRAERAEHTEASLAGDHHRHELRGPTETEESHQIVVQDELEKTTPSFFARNLQVNPVSVDGKVDGHIEEVSQRLEEQTQVDPLLQSVFGEHHHVQDVGRGAGKIRHTEIKAEKTLIRTFRTNGKQQQTDNIRNHWSNVYA